MKSVKSLLFCGACALALSSTAFAQSSQAAANAQYQQQLQQYQQQQSQYQAQRQNYDAQALRYQAARDHYRAERARYHRFGWPARYEHSIIADKGELLGAPVRTYNGREVGHVEELSLSPAGHVDAVRVTLDRNNRNVWIESADLRFDADRRVVMTNLDRDDLYIMANETY